MWSRGLLPGYRATIADAEFLADEAEANEVWQQFMAKATTIMAKKPSVVVRQ